MKYVAYSDIDVPADETIELNCDNYGRPRPIVTWFKDKQHLNLTDEKFRPDDSGSLRIVRTHAVDSGAYHCEVFNRYETISRSFNVRVKTDVLKITDKKQVVWIVLVSVFAIILFILLLLALAYALNEKQERTNLVVSYIV